MNKKQSAIVENLLEAAWDSHQEEIAQEHHGDRTCSFCQAMRAVGEILDVEPKSAGATTLEVGNHVYLPETEEEKT